MKGASERPQGHSGGTGLLLVLLWLLITPAGCGRDATTSSPVDSARAWQKQVSQEAELKRRYPATRYIRECGSGQTFDAASADAKRKVSSRIREEIESVTIDTRQYYSNNGAEEYLERFIERNSSRTSFRHAAFIVVEKRDSVRLPDQFIVLAVLDRELLARKYDADIETRKAEVGGLAAALSQAALRNDAKEYVALLQELMSCLLEIDEIAGEFMAVRGHESKGVMEAREALVIAKKSGMELRNRLNPAIHVILPSQSPEMKEHILAVVDSSLARLGLQTAIGKCGQDGSLWQVIVRVEASCGPGRVAAIKCRTCLNFQIMACTDNSTLASFEIKGPTRKHAWSEDIARTSSIAALDAPTIEGILRQKLSHLVPEMMMPEGE
jgi:hypothetical protein